MSEAFPDWQRQLQAASSKSPDAKHAFVATTRPDGTPAVRAMGFLGFAKGSSDVILQTHARSHKAEHLQHNPCVEICIYAHKTSEQFRIRGKLTVIGPGQSDEALQDERQRQWALQMPLSVRKWYASNRPPGQLLQEPDVLLQKDIPSKKDGPPDNFLVLLLHPSEVDYVELSHDIRAKYFRLEEDQRQHEDSKCAAEVAAAFSQKPDGQDRALLWRKQDVNP